MNEELRILVLEMVYSASEAERILGNLLWQSIRFVPEEQTADVLRNVTKGMEEALQHFDKKWMRLEFEAGG